MFKEGVAPLWATPTAAFNELGVGVSLYFRLVKALSVLFAAVTVLALPVMYLCYCGDGLGRGADIYALSRFTPGNFVRV
jgi:hypothetical protein